MPKATYDTDGNMEEAESTTTGKMEAAARKRNKGEPGKRKPRKVYDNLGQTGWEYKKTD